MGSHVCAGGLGSLEQFSLLVPRYGTNHRTLKEPEGRGSPAWDRRLLARSQCARARARACARGRRPGTAAACSTRKEGTVHTTQVPATALMRPASESVNCATTTPSTAVRMPRAASGVWLQRTRSPQPRASTEIGPICALSDSALCGSRCAACFVGD